VIASTTKLVRACGPIAYPINSLPHKSSAVLR
jgi:hypothetical protein